MYDKLEKNDSLVSWMIAGGARLDEPGPRHLRHLVELRDAKRGAPQSLSPRAWLTARFAPRTIVATSGGGAASIAASTASTTCCAPA